MEVSWILIPFLLPVLLFIVFAHRAIRVARIIRDPEQLQILLSDESRTALLQAGIDLDSISMQEIQESEELTRLIASDLRRALRSVVFGLPVRIQAATPDSIRLRADHGSGPSMDRWSPRASGQTGHLSLPPPIDQSSGLGLRIVLALAIIAIAAAAIFVVGSRR